MALNRWYPTNITLGNGDVLTVGGETEPKEVQPYSQKVPELWHNGTWTKLPTARRGTAPLYGPFGSYPHLFAAPNGKVFCAGPDYDMGYINPAGTGTWTSTLPTQTRAFNGTRAQGTAVMFAPGKILVIGGCYGSTVTNTAEIIDLTAGTSGSITGADNETYLRPVMVAVPPMRYARHHANATLLPDGTVLVTGGSRVVSERDPSMGVLEPELWTPPFPDGTGAAPGGTWTTLAPMAEARMYHSTAALLPDGRVLSAGGEEVIKYDPFTANVNNHCTAEIFCPPYLHSGSQPATRPTITGVNGGTSGVSGAIGPYAVNNGQTFTVQTPDAASIGKVTLVRLSSVTHSFNMNQRFNQLTLGTVTANSVTATVPSANDCPPGHYLLSVVNSAGVPSAARVIAVTPGTCLPAPTLTVALSTNDPCYKMAVATIGGFSPGAGTTIRWTLNGVAAPALTGAMTATYPLDLCRPQVTFGVEIWDAACGWSPYLASQSAGPYAFPNYCQCVAITGP